MIAVEKGSAMCDILIVGGDGDLAYRKLYVALYELDRTGQLPAGLRVLALARKPLPADEFPATARRRIEQYRNKPLDEAAWQAFAERLIYVQGDATSTADLMALRENLLQQPERELVVYLSTPAAIFAPVCQALAGAGLSHDGVRIVVEKPLGDSRAGFLAINAELTRIFSERQIFRIDHYLGKESVQNLLALRFSNSLFEPLWNHNLIDHVQITAAETIGVEGRWAFYDVAGALRDMVQNHLLQLLCLVAMEPPARLEAGFVRDEKLKVLHSLKPITGAAIRERTVRGQYRSGAVQGEVVPGYTEERDGGDSDTETFVAVKAEIMNWRWAGVPFYLRTGKRLARRFSEIVIQFREVAHPLFGDSGMPNRLVIRLQPDKGIQLRLMNKIPGLEADMPLQEVALNLSYSEAFSGKAEVDAYERLLLDAIKGNPTLFVRADEVEAAWAWIDHIAEGWRASRYRPAPYVAGGYGPPEAVAMLARDGRTWYDVE